MTWDSLRCVRVGWRSGNVHCEVVLWRRCIGGVLLIGEECKLRGACCDIQQPGWDAFRQYCNLGWQIVSFGVQ